MGKAKQRTIEIEQLDLDVLNFRLKAADSQEESIENMLEEQLQKLGNLAQDILDNGLNPSELLIGMWPVECPLIGSPSTTMQGGRSGSAGTHYMQSAAWPWRILNAPHPGAETP